MGSAPTSHLDNHLVWQALLVQQTSVEGKCWEDPHSLPQALQCDLYICWETSLNANWFQVEEELQFQQWTTYAFCFQ